MEELHENQETVSTLHEQPYQPLCPESWLVWAVLSTVCCCTPIGLVAIYHAARVNSYYEGGLYEQAERAASSARKWTIITFVVGAVIQSIYLGVVMSGGLKDLL